VWEAKGERGTSPKSETPGTPNDKLKNIMQIKIFTISPTDHDTGTEEMNDED
jgi:hypothetical protein